MENQEMEMFKEIAPEPTKQAGDNRDDSDDDDEDDDDDDSNDDDSKKQKKNPIEEKMPPTLHLLYAASKLIIYEIADKIAANDVTNNVPALSDVENAVDIPLADTWDFQLGDRVKIKYSLSDFKSIQSRTLGWTARLRTIHGCLGVVTARWSIYANGVTIFVPERLCKICVYAGLLEKVPEDERVEDKSFTTQWKVNDYVTTIMDAKVVELMQRCLDTIPQRYLGRKGKIIAVTRVAIVVTFNNRTSYDINSNLLIKCPDQTSLKVPERTHDKFVLGQKVRVLDNVTQLVKNQEDHGNWNEEMTRFVGKEVRIIHICKNNKIRVQYKLGRHWLINPESVHSLSELPKQTVAEDCEFMPGDIVKIRMTNNMRSLLQKKYVPTIFLDYLRSTAKVKLIDEDLDYLIKFNCDQNVAVYAPTIRKATREERHQHEHIKEEVKQIKAGSKVILDIGPPNYVRSVLSDSCATAEVVYALTHSSTLLGFVENHRAIIQYDSGKTYNIKKKFLTVPEKFNMQGNVDGMSFETAKEIQEAVAKCVEMLRVDDDVDEGRENPVRILSMSFDTTPTVDLRVYSVNAEVEKISETLLTNCSWNVEMRVVGDDVIYVSGLETFDREVQISFHFNQEPYKPTATFPSPVCTKASSVPQMQQFKEVKNRAAAQEEAHTPSSTAKAEAGPIPNEPYATGPRPPAGFVLKMMRPQSVHEFDYVPLPLAGVDNPVYLPYFFPRGQRRSAFTDNQSRQSKRAKCSDNGPTNIINIERIENFHNINN